MPYRKHLYQLTDVFSSRQNRHQHPNPKATLDITAKTDGTSAAEGLMIPRLTGDQIQTMTASIQPGTESLMIYATAVPASPTAKVSKITQPGYYFWNGNGWESMVSSNIYTADGSITTPLAARNVDLNGKNLVFSGNGSVGIGTAPLPQQNLMLQER
jgi:hypothetical protein